MAARPKYEYRCPRCGSSFRTSLNLPEQPTCANYAKHHSPKVYWMIPTDQSSAPKHPVSTDTRGTKA